MLAWRCICLGICLPRDRCDRWLALRVIGRGVVLVSVETLANALDLSLLGHAAEQEFERVALLRAGGFHKSGDALRLARLRQHCDNLCALFRGMNLCGSAENTPAATLLTELDGQLRRFDIAASDVEHGAGRLGSHNQYRVSRPGHTV